MTYRKNKAPVPSSQHSDNVVQLSAYRDRLQVLTEVVASRDDRDPRQTTLGTEGMFIRQAVPIDELSALRDQKSNPPPDDLIA